MGEAVVVGSLLKPPVHPATSAIAPATSTAAAPCARLLTIPESSPTHSRVEPLFGLAGGGGWDSGGVQTDQPSAKDIRRWRGYLADERAEARVYREFAARRSGEEREIFLALAEAEGRHEAHWLALLGEHAGKPRRGSLRTRLLALLARRFGSVFVLALAQQAEARSSYAADADATPAMVADELTHQEVVRTLAVRGRNKLSGSLRAAVFGANDGLVSNLALIAGIGATGVEPRVVLLTGVAGLLAGALSMGAGEYVSVSSQRELLEASAPDPAAIEARTDLDLDANELALVYRARGLDGVEAIRRADATLRALHGDERAAEFIANVRTGPTDPGDVGAEARDMLGTAWGAASSSFCFFAVGAIVPLLPFLFGMTGLAAIITAAVVVGAVLLLTGAIVGVLSGASPGSRALRQLAIGFGAAVVTYVLGLAFGAVVG